MKQNNPMAEIKWALPKAPKEVERLFDAKVEVTEKDAKKMNPLTKFWKGKMTHAYKFGLAHGILLGGLFACAIIGLLSFFRV